MNSTQKVKLIFKWVRDNDKNSKEIFIEKEKLIEKFQYFEGLFNNNFSDSKEKEYEFEFDGNIFLMILKNSFDNIKSSFKIFDKTDDIIFYSIDNYIEIARYFLPKYPLNSIKINKDNFVNYFIYYGIDDDLNKYINNSMSNKRTINFLMKYFDELNLNNKKKALSEFIETKNKKLKYLISQILIDPKLTKQLEHYLNRYYINDIKDNKDYEINEFTKKGIFEIIKDSCINGVNLNKDIIKICYTKNFKKNFKIYNYYINFLRYNNNYHNKEIFFNKTIKELYNLNKFNEIAIILDTFAILTWEYIEKVIKICKLEKKTEKIYRILEKKCNQSSIINYLKDYEQQEYFIKYIITKINLNIDLNFNSEIIKLIRPKLKSKDIYSIILNNHYECNPDIFNCNSLKSIKKMKKITSILKHKYNTKKSESNESDSELSEGEKIQSNWEEECKKAAEFWEENTVLDILNNSNNIKCIDYIFKKYSDKIYLYSYIIENLYFIKYPLEKIYQTINNNKENEKYIIVKLLNSESKKKLTIDQIIELSKNTKINKTFKTDDYIKILTKYLSTDIYNFKKIIDYFGLNEDTTTIIDSLNKVDIVDIEEYLIVIRKYRNESEIINDLFKRTNIETSKKIINYCKKENIQINLIEIIKIIKNYNSEKILYLYSELTNTRDFFEKNFN